MMKTDRSEALLTAIRRMPEWIRVDLSAKDAIVRERAEETLAMVLGSAEAAGVDEACCSTPNPT